jgi:hypothetical protein
MIFFRLYKVVFLVCVEVVLLVRPFDVELIVDLGAASR